MSDDQMTAVDGTSLTSAERAVIQARMEAKGLNVEPLNHGRHIDFLLELLDRTNERLASEVVGR